MWKLPWWLLALLPLDEEIPANMLKLLWWLLALLPLDEGNAPNGLLLPTNCELVLLEVRRCGGRGGDCSSRDEACPSEMLLTFVRGRFGVLCALLEPELESAAGRGRL